MAQLAQTAERKFHQKWWFSFLLAIVGGGLALVARELGFDVRHELTTFATVLGVFMLLTLAYPRLCPWMHRRLRIALRLDDPEQKRKAGLPVDD